MHLDIIQRERGNNEVFDVGVVHEGFMHKEEVVIPEGDLRMLFGMKGVGQPLNVPGRNAIATEFLKVWDQYEFKDQRSAAINFIAETTAWFFGKNVRGNDAIAVFLESIKEIISKKGGEPDIKLIFIFREKEAKRVVILNFTNYNNVKGYFTFNHWTGKETMPYGIMKEHIIPFDHNESIDEVKKKLAAIVKRIRECHHFFIITIKS